jgi:hypothetical protein
MAWRIALLVWGTLGTIGGVLWLTGGALSTRDTVDALAGLAVLAALWLTIKLPWDLYFAARAVQIDQAESVARGLQIADAERAETRQLVRRTLALAIGLHLAGAAACLALTAIAGGQVGLVAAGAFLASMVLRPGATVVGHMRRRLSELGRRARIPREDAVELARRVLDLEERQADLQRRVAHDITGLTALHDGLEKLDARTDSRIRTTEQRFRQDVDRVCVEFERAIERLTSDRELLAGIRAFLALVRQGST